jgi:hypothetical protein
MSKRGQDIASRFWMKSTAAKRLQTLVTAPISIHIALPLLNTIRLYVIVHGHSCFLLLKFRIRGKPMRLIAAVLAVLALSSVSANAADIPTRFEWMLPKTVLDTVIAYQFQGCTKNGTPQFKITPTLSPKTVADQYVGQRSVFTDQLQSLWEDRNISVQTFGGSRILNSLGSSPTGQAGQIITNILGGIGKIIGIATGVVMNVDDASIPVPACDNTSDPAKMVTQINTLKSQVADYQLQLANSVDDSTQKKLTAAIQASQAVISNLQDQLTINVKTTIDPGVTAIIVNADDNTDALNASQARDIDDGGLVATICPSPAQLTKAKWLANLDKILPGGKANCANVPYLTVNVYLEFKKGHSMPWDDGSAGPYKHKKLADPDYYRDVAYIPVAVWRGNKDGQNKGALGADGSVVGPVQLAPAQVMAFGQFGVAQTLPLSSDGFKKMVWQVTFLENGEITAATFTSQQNAAAATSLLQGATNTAASVANAERTAQSASTMAAQAQGEADLIYQSQRLHACQLNPSTCTSK